MTRKQEERTAATETERERSPSMFVRAPEQASYRSAPFASDEKTSPQVDERDARSAIGGLRTCRRLWDARETRPRALAKEREEARAVKLLLFA
jgi:hypothetical protein